MVEGELDDRATALELACWLERLVADGKVFDLSAEISESLLMLNQQMAKGEVDRATEISDLSCWLE